MRPRSLPLGLVLSSVLSVAATTALGTLTACGGDDAWALMAETDTWLLSTWGPGDGSRYAAGGVFGGDGRILFREADEAFAPLALPADTPLVNWVHGFDADDVWFAASEGVVLRRQGGAFSRIDTDVDAPLWGIFGMTPDDLWVVGGDANAEDDAVLLRGDASGFSAVPLPALDRPLRALFKAWGTARDDVYFVGSDGVVLHWDGEALSQILVGTAEDLIALWGTGPDDITIVGGRSNGIVAHFDGTEWRSRNLAPLPGLNGVFMERPGRARVVGLAGTIAEVTFPDFDVTTEDPVSRETLHAVHGDGRTYAAVGGNLERPLPPFTGIVVER